MTSKSLSSLWRLVNMLSYRDTSHKLCIYILFCYNSSLLNKEVKFCQGKMSSGLLSQLTTCQKKTKWIPGEVFQTEKTLRLLREKLLIMTQPYQPCRRYFLVHNWWSVKWQSSITVYQSPIGSIFGSATSAFKSTQQLPAKVHTELFDITHIWPGYK